MPAVYNYPRPDTQSPGVKRLYAATCDVRSKGQFRNLLEDHDRFKGEANGGRTSSMELGANCNARDLRYALVHDKTQQKGVSITAKELARMPLSKRLSYTRQLLPMQKKNTQTMVDPDNGADELLARLIEDAIESATRHRLCLPKVMTTQERAVPPNGAVLPTFPPYIASPRAIHPEVPFDLETYFVTRIEKILDSQPWEPLHIPELRALLSRLPIDRRMYHVGGRENVQTHKDRFDAWHLDDAHSGARDPIHGLFRCDLSVPVNITAPGSGCTYQALGVGKSKSGGCVGISDEKLKYAHTVALGMAEQGGMQAFSGATIPHGSTTIAYGREELIAHVRNITPSKGTLAAEAEQFAKLLSKTEGQTNVNCARKLCPGVFNNLGMSGQWRAANPSAREEVDGLLASPELRLFRNLRTSQKNVEAYQCLFSVTARSLVSMATPAVMTFRRAYGIAKMEGREETLMDQKDLEGEAWKYYEVKRAINHVSPMAITKSQSQVQEEAADDPGLNLSLAAKKNLREIGQSLRLTMHRRREGVKLGDRLQYCRDHFLQVGDVISGNLRVGDVMSGSWRVVEVHNSLRELPAHLAHARHVLKGDICRTYDLSMVDRGVWSQHEADQSTKCGVQLAGLRITVERGNRRQSGRIVAAEERSQEPPAWASPIGGSPSRLEQAPPAASDIGRRLSVLWDGGKWYDGVLTKIRDNHECYVIYDDGDRQWELLGRNDGEDPAVSYKWLPEQPAPSQSHLGRKLEVYWPGDNKWYAGTLTNIRSGSGSKFFVLYDDGEKSWEALGTPDHRFRWLMPPTKRQKKIH